MNKWILLSTILLFFISGCSEGNSEGVWNYKEGYIIAKEDQKVLVVRHVTKNDQKSVSKILEDNAPNAIWLTVKNVDKYDSFEVGAKVQITIDGPIEKSYPAQAVGTIS